MGNATRPPQRFCNMFKRMETQVPNLIELTKMKQRARIQQNYNQQRVKVLDIAPHQKKPSLHSACWTLPNFPNHSLHSALYPTHSLPNSLHSARWRIILANSLHSAHWTPPPHSHHHHYCKSLHSAPRPPTPFTQPLQLSSLSPLDPNQLPSVSPQNPP